MTDRLLTIADAADLLQVNERTVRRAITDGGLRAHQVGERHTWRIREADLEEWLDGRANRPARVEALTAARGAAERDVARIVRPRRAPVARSGRLEVVDSATEAAR